MNQDRIKRLYEQAKEKEQQQRQWLIIEQQVKSKFTKDALERYGNLKVAYPKKASHLILQLAKVTDKIDQIDDQQLKSILKRISPKKHDYKIRRK